MIISMTSNLKIKERKRFKFNKCLQLPNLGLNFSIPIFITNKSLKLEHCSYIKKDDFHRDINIYQLININFLTDEFFCFSQQDRK